MKKLIILALVLGFGLNIVTIYVLAKRPAPVNTNTTTIYEGKKGDPGEIGQPGEQGFQGLQGFAGINGATGVKGDTGATGAQGQKGDTGEKGEKGEDAEPVFYEWRCHPSVNIRQYRVVGETLWKNEPNSTCRVV